MSGSEVQSEVPGTSTPLDRLKDGELTAKLPPNRFVSRRQFVPPQLEPEPRARAPGPE